MRVDLHKFEEDIPLLLNRVASSYVILEEDGEKVEGIDGTMEVHTKELEEDKYIVRVVLAV